MLILPVTEALPYIFYYFLWFFKELFLQASDDILNFMLTDSII